MSVIRGRRSRRLPRAGVGVAWSLVARPCPIPCHACKGFQGRRFPSRLFRSISLLSFLSPPLSLSICRPAPAAPSIGTTAGLHIAVTTTITRGLAHTHSTIPALSAGGRADERRGPSSWIESRVSPPVSLQVILITDLLPN